MLHVRTGRPVGIFPLACLPALSGHQPGRKWLHEIKHDGFRIMARRDDNGVRLYTRNGYDFAGRFPQIVEAACPNLRCAPASSTARPSWSMSVVFQPLTCCAPGGMTMWRLPRICPRQSKWPATSSPTCRQHRRPPAHIRRRVRGRQNDAI
jgi:hypothetical protein